jgi:hypothetical protein
MLYKLLFLFAGALTMSFASAQSTAVVGNVDAVKTTPALKTLADQVNIAYADLSQQAVTGTRSTAATAKNNYDAALNAYLEELKIQLSSADNTITEALKSEITLVQQLLGSTATTSSSSR